MGFPLHKPYTAYIGEYLHFRYLKCLVTATRAYFLGGDGRHFWVVTRISPYRLPIKTVTFPAPSQQKVRRVKKRPASANNVAWIILMMIYCHMLHGVGTFTYMYHEFQPNVGKYSSPMEHIGYNTQRKT